MSLQIFRTFRFIHTFGECEHVKQPAKYEYNDGPGLSLAGLRDARVMVLICSRARLEIFDK